jgi:hypothetical protein
VTSVDHSPPGDPSDRPDRPGLHQLIDELSSSTDSSRAVRRGLRDGADGVRERSRHRADPLRGAERTLSGLPVGATRTGTRYEPGSAGTAAVAGAVPAGRAGFGFVTGTAGTARATCGRSRTGRRCGSVRGGSR